MSEIPLLRLFIAVSTPGAIAAQLGELSGKLRRSDADIRWERVEKMHVTLKFLGETPKEKIAELREALDRVASSTPPFTVELGGIGGFPTLRSPRVLWVGIEDPSGTLHRVHAAIEESLARKGIARDERAFHPHITLGRIRSPRNLAGLLGMVESLTLERQPVQLHDILLIKSELKPDGSVHRTLHTAAFVGNQAHHG